LFVTHQTPPFGLGTVHMNLQSLSSCDNNDSSPQLLLLSLFDLLYTCVCVCACVRACVRACSRACLRSSMRTVVHRYPLFLRAGAVSAAVKPLHQTPPSL